MSTAGSRSVNTALTITHLPAFFSLLFQWTWVYSVFRKCRLGKGWLMVIQDRPATGQGVSHLWAQHPSVWKAETWAGEWTQVGTGPPQAEPEAPCLLCALDWVSLPAGAVGQAGLGPDVVLSWPSGQSRFQDSWLDRERGNSHSGDRDTNLVSHTVGDSTTLGSEGDTTDRLQADRGTGCHHSHGDAVQRHRVLGDRKEVGEAWEPSGGGPFTAG